MRARDQVGALLVVLGGVRGEQGVLFEQGELGGHAEGLLAGAQPGREVQDAGGGVVAVELPVGLGVGGDPDAVALVEPGGEGPAHLAGADADLLREFLGGEVGVVEVVAAPVEELADLLVRRAGARRVRGGRVVAVAGQGGEALGEGLAAAAEVEEDGGHVREAGGEFREVGGGERGAVELVGEGLAQVGQEPAGVPLGEEVGVDAERLGDPQEDGDREGRVSCSIWFR